MRRSLPSRAVRRETTWPFSPSSCQANAATAAIPAARPETGRLVRVVALALPGGPIGFPVRVPGGDGVPLVIGPAAPRQSQLQLGPPVDEVDRQWDERQALLGRALAQLVDLAAVQEQLAPPVGISRAH